jgi:hypothetical protein
MTRADDERALCSLLNRLVRAGLATSHTERGKRGDKEIEIVRLKITDAGRRAL